MWNDHGAAIRSHSLAMLALAAGETEQTSELRDCLWGLLAEHAEFLADETHYTFKHNHGIMQDAALLEIAFLIPSDSQYAAECANWVALAKDRLDGQRQYAYSTEMVHVENSMAHQSENLGKRAEKK